MSKSVQELVKETITIQKAGNWGPMANDIWYGINEPLTKDDFKQGETLTVLVKQGKPTEKNPAGKKYIAQIVGQETSIPAPQVVVARTPTAVTQHSVTKIDYVKADQEKSTRILRQGIVQAVAQSPLFAGFGGTPKEFTDQVKEVSTDLIAFVEGK